MAPSNYSYKYFNVTFPQEHVAHVEINRPEKLNAFVEEMWLNLGQIFNKLSHDPDVRCVVLSGAGDRAFTAGLDVQAASQGSILGASGTKLDVARTATGIRRHIFEFQSCITAIEKCEKPVISILHGYTYGLGLDIASSTDIRLSTTMTLFSVKEVDIGLAADIGTLSRLPKCVGNQSWVKDICLTARQFSSEEALRFGLVSGVFGDKAEALREGFRIAGVVAGKSPVAVQGTKSIVNYSRDHSVEEGLNYTAIWNAAMVQTEDVKAAMLAGLQKDKKKPTFSKL
ncbi:hypothetical protein W97_07786 [Coniosporium apollinis CBS 100218]|uniref:Uncharacterized protein n=1 Tax=Coniosporium apollinis (strain CBS 100218) TaxID=1168221 RepID=R7Z353_CONA1|nr:uncharacterized protein W97_07786 [Coniosporium apollinis CBS 100218]EON68528.1 hypothetical protein W97_07786 [Coniosporium apollinis CBS 100218]